MAASNNQDAQAGTPPLQEVSRSIARALLLALAFCLPFEAPLFTLGPLVMTSVEVMLYLSIVGWVAALALAVGGSRSAWPARVRAALADVVRDPIARAVGIWLAVTAVSAAAAPSYRAAALKFALRTLSGGLLYFAARDLMRPSLHARRLMLALLAGAVASASLTLLETVRPEWTAWWRPFRPQEILRQRPHPSEQHLRIPEHRRHVLGSVHPAGPDGRDRTQSEQTHATTNAPRRPALRTLGPRHFGDRFSRGAWCCSIVCQGSPDCRKI